MRSACRNGQGVEPGERGREVDRPGSGLLDPSEGAALTSGDPSGDVEQAVAQGLRFGLGEMAVEEKVLGPSHQVDGEHHGGQPSGVDGKRPGGEMV
jgi:hypothetical protein